MSDWISVYDYLPNDINFKKYKVKMQVGSIQPKEVITIVLGKMYPSQFRFMTGDWERVTHWTPLHSPPSQDKEKDDARI